MVRGIPYGGRTYRDTPHRTYERVGGNLRFDVPDELPTLKKAVPGMI